jgi:hypothetical protein
MQDDSRRSSFYAKVAAAGAALALIAGIIANSKAIYEAACRAVGRCATPTFRFEGEYATTAEILDLEQKLLSLSGRVAYFDLRIVEPVFDGTKSLNDEWNGPNETCVGFVSDKSRTIYCSPDDGRNGSVFSPEKSYVFVWSGYYNVSSPYHQGQGHYKVKLTPLAAEVAIPLLKQQ